MLVQFRNNGTDKKHTIKHDVGDYYILESHPPYWSSDCFIAVRKSAVDIVEGDYHVGQRFKVGFYDNDSILAHVGGNMVTFIGVNSGYSYCASIKVKNLEKVTKDELNTLALKWSLINP